MLGPEDVSLLERCPHFRGCYARASVELGPEDVSLLERCPHFRGCYARASVELGPEDVSLLERCPHFRGCYARASVELGPEDVSLLGRFPHFGGCYDCYSWCCLQLKLSDFGMARLLDEQTGVYNLSNLQSRIPIAWYVVRGMWYVLALCIQRNL